MMSVAGPRIFGASTSSVTLATARSSDARDADASPGRSRAARRRVEVLKSFDRAERDAGGAQAPAEPGAGLRRATGWTTSSTCLDGVGPGRRLERAHAASSAVSCDATISA